MAWEKWLWRQFNFDFVRLSKWDGVFEHIDIDSSGKKGEAVVCRVFLSPLLGHRIHFKPSPEIEEFVFELADPKWDHRYTLIESDEDAATWEERVADIAPPHVCDLANQHGEEMALQTMVARASAQRYVQRIREFSTEPVMEYLAVQLKSGRAPVAMINSIKFGGLMTSQDDLSDAMECASFAISKFGMEVDPDHNGFQGESKSRNRELRLRLDITADLLRNGA
ncbi:hypothetical protein [Bremerella sp.]|uniref:hypothetical protein n=1 Tax=Bremerella sp. TaxID=2795602 RepID=UPI00391D3711